MAVKAKTHKVKTHKGAKKRFKISANGKLLFQKQGKRHILTSKNRKRKRRLKETGVITGTVAKNIAKIMPYA